MQRAHFDPDSTDSRLLTRRRALASVAGLAGGGVTLAHLATGDAVAADVTMDTLDVAGDSATVSGEPQAIMVNVAGEYSVDASTLPDQARTVIQIHVPPDDTADDLDENVFMDSVASGTYSHEVDLLDHRAIDAADVTPDGPDDVIVMEILVRVVLLAVSGGSIQKETFVEDTAPIEIRPDGVSLAVGGSGEVVIETA